MATEQTRDAQAIIESMERYHGVKLEKPQGDDGPILAAVPSGMKLESIKKLLDEYLEVPERKTGTTVLTTLAAFSDFVNRHKTEDSIVFLNDANPRSLQAVAIFDAHKGTVRSDIEKSVGPDWQAHRAVYNFPMSEEWKAWTSLPEAFTQALFAQFLEDRILDVGVAQDSVTAFARDIGVQLASAAKLLELSRGLAVTVDSRVANQVNLSSGEGSLTFTEEHKDAAGAPIKVPGAFAIDIPVFRLGARFQVPVRLRYRVSGGKVSWYLTPQRLDKVLELALEEAHEVLESRTELPVFRGAP